MNKWKLGHTGLKVSEMGHGTLMYGPKISEEAAQENLSRYAAAGGNFIDTANIYGRSQDGPSQAGDSERFIGKWLRKNGHREDFIIATKMGFPYPGIEYGTSPKQIREECDKSLKNLGVDCIDLYYLHTDDTAVPMEESLGTLQELIQEGKVRHIGASNFPAWRLERAGQICQKNGWEPFCCIQQRHSYLRPKPEAVFPFQRYVNEELREYVSDSGITLIAYCPLIKGAYTGGKAFHPNYISADATARLKALDTIAAETGYSRTQLVFYWLMHSEVPALPLVATSNEAQFREAMSALEVKLTEEQMDVLTTAGE